MITGGTGFVGSNLVRRLIQDGHEVGLLVRAAHDPWRLTEVAGQARWITADLEGGIGLLPAIASFRPQWIFHLAANGAYSWQRDPISILKTNVLGTANLLGACLEVGFEAFVNTGSSSEYGFKDHAPSEDEVLEPRSAYAVAKGAATLFCAQVAKSNGVRVATLRLYSVYGPWEDPQRFIAQLVARGLEGRLPPLASPDTARDYIYISDVCEAYLAAARGSYEPGSIFNVGTGVQTTLREAVEIARKALDIPVAPVWQSMPDRGWDTSTWVADSSRLRKELGWQPAIALKDGLQLTAGWMAAHPESRDRYRAASS